MLTLYWITFALISVITAVLYRIKGGVSALCLIPIVGFASYFCLHHSSLWGYEYYLTDSIRVSAIMIVVLMCGMKSNNPKLYLIYSVVLFSTITLNAFKLFFHGQFQINNLYLALTAMELVLFAFGVKITLNAKTKDASNALLDNNAFDIFHSGRGGIDSSPNAS